MTNDHKKPYFLQTSQWSQFWLEHVQKNHQIHFISHKNENIELSAYIYQYPWHLGKSFLYIPKGPIFKIYGNISKNQIVAEYKVFLNKITKFATQNKYIFIKLDFDYQFTNLLGIHDSETLLRLIEKLVPLHIKLSEKKLQYLSTMTLDCSRLQKSDDMTEFLDTNKDFWSQTNENIRRYTRKALKQNWQVDTSKTTDNFEAFWQVYESTAKRQKFAIHPKSYFNTMFKKKFVRIIVLKDEQNIPHCCWFGVLLNDTLYYLYGGNDNYSFDHQGQYLAHLIALQIASNEKIKQYDLGGYDSEKGFGKFKEGYRGNIVNFLGPVDIVLQPKIYNLINTVINFVKKLKKY